jgi:hypothetical protein
MIRTIILSLVVSLSAHAAGLTFTAPAAWKSVATASSMRVAQYTLSRVAGDTADAELVVYYFGGSGGTVEANIERWVAQMQQPDGRPSSAVAKRQSRTINGLKVTLVDVPGTYVAEMTPGAAERHNSPNFHLRAAVIETANGPYFIKLTGPAKTIAASEKQFEAFLASSRRRSISAPARDDAVRRKSCKRGSIDRDGLLRFLCGDQTARLPPPLDTCTRSPGPGNGCT